jgi:hypothetical protein
LVASAGGSLADSSSWNNFANYHCSYRCGFQDYSNLALGTTHGRTSDRIVQERERSLILKMLKQGTKAGQRCKMSIRPWVTPTLSPANFNMMAAAILDGSRTGGPTNEEAQQCCKLSQFVLARLVQSRFFKIARSLVWMPLVSFRYGLF